MNPDIPVLHDVGQSTRYSYTNKVSEEGYIRINEEEPWA